MAERTKDGETAASGTKRNREVYIKFESPDLDCSNIQIHKLKGREAISEFFEFDVQIVCLDPAAVVSNKLAGLAVTLVFCVDDEPQRRVFGMINRVQKIYDSSQKYDAYDIRIVPHQWALSLHRSQEIYLNLSVIDIIEQKLKVANFGQQGRDYEMRLHRSRYPVREFVMQYDETDWDFVCRLCEHVGISFYFEHGDVDSSGDDGPIWDRTSSEGVEKIVFVDHYSQYPPISGDTAIPYLQSGMEKDLYWLGLTEQFVPQRFWVRDYNYEIPHHAAEAFHVLKDIDWTAGGHVEFGSNTLSNLESEIVAKARAEAALTARQTIEGRSDVVRLSAGNCFDIEDFEDVSDTLLVTEVQHTTTQTVLTGGRADNELYRNRFRAIRNLHTFRPERKAPRPRIDGVVTGEVVGIGTSTVAGKPSQPDVPVGALDAEGRYLVQLHLDTPGRDVSHQGEDAISGGNQPLASLPIRMAQPSSGANYGMHFPLREGVEVLVAFINGDPDRPVIVGSVSNRATPNAITHSNANTSTIRTQTGIVMEFSDG